MSYIRQHPVIATALALFAMLFGSGNIAFPLGLGRDLGDVSFYAMIGFFLTAALIPVLGVIAMALYNGDYRAFMSRIGAIPARVVIAICFALMGPFCVIPRCLAFSHLALVWMLPSVSAFAFSIVAGAIMLLVTWRKSGVVPLMSAVLGPLKLILLSLVIIKGVLAPINMASCAVASQAAFTQGFLSGFGTLDLLAVMFFSGLLLAGIATDDHGRRRSSREQVKLLIKAGILGALLLGILYAGFVIVAARQSASPACLGIQEGQLLSVLASIILGAGGGYLASITMIAACSTTAIALTTVFADYLATSWGRGTISYHAALCITTAISMVFTNIGADGIKTFLVPIVTVLYPALMVLAVINIMWKAWNIDLGRWPFYATLGISIVLRLAPLFYS